MAGSLIPLAGPLDSLHENEGVYCSRRPPSTTTITEELSAAGPVSYCRTATFTGSRKSTMSEHPIIGGKVIYAGEKPDADADAIERLEEARVGGKRVLVSLDETTRIPVEPSIPIIIRAVRTTTMDPLG